jgi:hypothetical protein
MENAAPTPAAAAGALNSFLHGFTATGDEAEPTIAPRPTQYKRPSMQPLLKPSSAPTSMAAGAVSSLFAALSGESGEKKKTEVEKNRGKLPPLRAPEDFKSQQDMMDALHRAQNAANNQF